MHATISSKVGSVPGLSGSAFVLIWPLFFAGQLPKELGKLVNLKVLIVSCNIQFDDEGEPIPGTGFSGMQMVAPVLSA